jgi:hypothetical protein
MRVIDIYRFAIAASSISRRISNLRIVEIIQDIKDINDILYVRIVRIFENAINLFKVPETY